MKSTSTFRSSAPILLPVFVLALCLIALGLSGGSPGSALRVAAQGAALLEPLVSPTVPVRPTAVTSDSAGVPANHGVLYYWSDSGTLFRVDVHTAQATPVVTLATADNVTGLAVGRNTQELYGCHGGALYIMLRDGGGFMNPAAVSCHGLAYLAPDRLYCVYDTSFFRIDLLAFEKVSLPSPGLGLNSLAEDPEGNLVYGLAVNGELLEYRFDEGHWIDVGNTGLDGTRSGLAYDPIDHVLYAVGSGMGGNLYRVDPDEASVTLVGSL
ncbi:MAG: NHL repeat-containing protein, partial [Anaerolineae bacterium]